MTLQPDHGEVLGWLSLVGWRREGAGPKPCKLSEGTDRIAGTIEGECSGVMGLSCLEKVLIRAPLLAAIVVVAFIITRRKMRLIPSFRQNRLNTDRRKCRRLE